jgi:predicted glycosyltransferase
MKKVLFYCQHVLGMGHFIRSMEIIRGLKDFAVRFCNGGENIPGFMLPPSVTVVNLPPLKSNADFTDIQVMDNLQNLAEIKEIRTRRLLDEFEQFKPDLVIIELFPFGRKKFAFELVPLLTRIRLARGKTKVVCSLRDILSVSAIKRAMKRGCVP